MPLLTSAQVVINTRTLRIGGQTYSLGNLARVQIVKLAKPSRAGKGNAKLAALAGFGFFIFVAAIASSTGISAIGSIAGLLAIGLGVFIYQKTKGTLHSTLRLDVGNDRKSTDLLGLHRRS